MSLEIHQQPRVLERLLAEQDQCAAQIAAAIRERDACYPVFAARGTSDNAARYAQYLVGYLNQLPVALATPSLFSIYGAPPRLRNALVLGVSQSGETPGSLWTRRSGRLPRSAPIGAYLPVSRRPSWNQRERPAWRTSLSS